MEVKVKHIFLFCLLIYVLYACGRLDDSDTSMTERSGMVPHKDALTGCEYLSTPFAGMTPRLGNDGKQICHKIAQ